MKKYDVKGISIMNNSSLMMIVFFFMTLTGCMFSKSEPVPLEPVPINRIQLKFGSPLSIGTPVIGPSSVKDHILCGLFYFDHTRFEEASEEFKKAYQAIPDSRNRLYQRCVSARTVCLLLSGDRDGFNEEVQKLKSTYTNYELMAIESIDQHAEAIFEIYKDFQKNR